MEKVNTHTGRMLTICNIIPNSMVAIFEKDGMTRLWMEPSPYDEVNVTVHSPGPFVIRARYPGWLPVSIVHDDETNDWVVLEQKQDFLVNISLSALRSFSNDLLNKMAKECELMVPSELFGDGAEQRLVLIKSVLNERK